MGYFDVLLVVHIGGAIVGFGPTFGYAVSGPLAARLGGPAAGGIMQSMLAISRRLVIPIAAVTQPVSGVLLIFESKRNENFFSYEWLWIAIVLYVAMFYTAVFVQTPALENMIRLAGEGKAETPEFEKLALRNRVFGPVLTALLVIIVFLMIVKPGE